ncbi:nucleotide exchange factor GrpE [Blautia hydrogenotrophica]|uniref:nucleotide exchange factor GrpE n=1 Tax=Blautia hydrogenotrophica TaxID=53443 RepID=UPI0006C520F8|nr:nucleotide exchange factor GrpE [Blautia hydrogenotrophica]MEE0463241.1 nucleotide exchange factor GrpE [Blautia hydrogenotrophica]CUN16915.1 HSP-70 cofactor [Blautia hydrogenotrophica]SCI24274.1 HSP-70 cofactor [uncultured Blautia sp.]
MSEEKKVQEEMEKQETVQEEPSETEVKSETEEKGTDDVDTSSDSAKTEEVQENKEASENEAPKGKTSFFGKKKEKKDKKDQQIADLTDRLQRTMAEFDNFRKRTEKEKASMYIIGAKEIVEKILPVVDNFERGLATAQEGDAFADGMKMIYKQLMTTLDELGVKPIEAVGQPFDPNYHNAVMHVEDESLGENVVAEELQKGYTYKDFVIRHSMVKVAN